jgi:hypothetical protein
MWSAISGFFIMFVLPVIFGAGAHRFPSWIGLPIFGAMILAALFWFWVMLWSVSATHNGTSIFNFLGSLLFGLPPLAGLILGWKYEALFP